MATWFAVTGHPKEDGWVIVFVNNPWNPYKRKLPQSFIDLYDAALGDVFVAYRDAGRLAELPEGAIELGSRESLTLLYEPGTALNSRQNAQRGAFLWQSDPFAPISAQTIPLWIPESAKKGIPKQVP